MPNKLSSSFEITVLAPSRTAVKCAKFVHCTFAIVYACPLLTHPHYCSTRSLAGRRQFLPPALHCHHTISSFRHLSCNDSRHSLSSCSNSGDQLEKRQLVNCYQHSDAIDRQWLSWPWNILQPISMLLPDWQVWCRHGRHWPMLGNEETLDPSNIPQRQDIFRNGDVGVSVWLLPLGSRVSWCQSRQSSTLGANDCFLLPCEPKHTELQGRVGIDALLWFGRS